jgi:excinuclease ABC subunit A
VRERLVADRIVREIRDRLEFLEAVGLNYLSLDRAANTLSGGESQRIPSRYTNRFETPRSIVRAG